MTYIVLAVVIAGVVLAIRSVINQKKSGGCSGCGTDCNCCSAHIEPEQK